MTAIVLTGQQALDLEAANAAAGSNRALKPRLLQDGRLILNADILDDPFFTDASHPWASVLGISAPQEFPADQTGDLGAPQSGVPVSETQSSSLPIINLTDAELAEPQ